MPASAHAPMPREVRGLDAEEKFEISRLSVCHIVSGDVWGGAEAQVASLLKELHREPGLTLRAIVLNEGRLAQELRDAGIEVKLIAEREKRFPQIFLEAARYLKDKQVQLLHSHRYKENLLALLLSRRRGIRFLVRTQHGRMEAHAGFKGLKQRFYYAADAQLARHFADKVISVSNDLTGYLEKFLAPRQIAVIRNGIDLNEVRCELTPAAAKQRLGVPEDAPVVGIACRLQRVKRLDLFLRAAGKIAERLPDAIFLIAGEGPEEDSLGELVQRFGLEGRVRLLGHRSDAYAVLRAMDVLLITSDHEGLPMVLLESLALGVPVVSRRIGGIPEVIQDRVSGLLVPTGNPDALAEACFAILRDHRLAKTLAEAGTKVVAEDYSSSRNAADVLELYRSLAKQAR